MKPNLTIKIEGSKNLKQKIETINEIIENLYSNQTVKVDVGCNIHGVDCDEKTDFIEVNVAKQIEVTKKELEVNNRVNNSLDRYIDMFVDYALKQNNYCKTPNSYYHLIPRLIYSCTFKNIHFNDEIAPNIRRRLTNEEYSRLLVSEQLFIDILRRELQFNTYYKNIWKIVKIELKKLKPILAKYLDS